MYGLVIALLAPRRPGVVCAKAVTKRARLR